MSLRASTRQKGANDYSNLGVSGRRTGLVLPQGRLDNNGIEEISGIFSSPRKPSPLRRVSSAQDLVAAREVENITPKQRRSSRKAHVARSASPRKSGISGTARRSNAVDIMRQNPTKENQIIESGDASKSPVPIARFDTRSQSPIPQRETNTVHVHRTTPRGKATGVQSELAPQHISSRTARPASVEPRGNSPENMGEAIEDDEPQIRRPASIHTLEYEALAPMYDSDDESPVEPEKHSQQRTREPMTANSTRKRKSDVVQLDYEADMQSSPAAKRAKRISDDKDQRKEKSRHIVRESDGEIGESIEPEIATKPQSKQKTTASTMSARQQNELDEMVEKIRSRPGQNKSLYLLRRVSRDENAVQTRSGRVSFKPLAYWRNERCVLGGSPNGATLQDGARFPLNSIKEIIRTEEDEDKKLKKRRKPGQKKSGNKAAGRAPISDSSDEEYDDPDAEAWETKKGTIRGTVSVWDQEYQVPIEEEEEVDIAYSAGAIQTKEVPGADFRYAKTLSTRFMGSGLVELPGGTIKKPKNSRKMQMTFFVAKGRVTVSVGPDGQDPTTFSIGKGGFWQVPRGNQYSIENEHEKTALIFFSQGCDTEQAAAEH